MQSQRFADDEAEQARLRNIQQQQQSHINRHQRDLKNKQEMASVHQQQYTAPQSWRQQTGQAPNQQHFGGGGGGFGSGPSPQQYGGGYGSGSSPQPPSSFNVTQSYPGSNQGGGQQFQQGGGQQQFTQSGGQSFQPMQHQSGGQQDYRQESLYHPSQLQQQKYYAEDDEEQRRLAQIKQQQQQHVQRYQQSLSQHQNQPKTTFGTDFRNAANQPQYYQQPRAGQLQSQQFADDEQEQERLRQIAEHQKHHTQQYHQGLRQHQQDAQARNKFMFGGMDFTKK